MNEFIHIVTDVSIEWFHVVTYVLNDVFVHIVMDVSIEGRSYVYSHDVTVTNGDGEQEAGMDHPR